MYPMQNVNTQRHKVENLAVIQVSGEDCLTFLQGQLTNDIDQLDECWQFSGYCNPKGRLLAILRLWKHDESVYAVLDTSILENVVKRLQMYIMRSKVVVEVLHNAQCFSSVKADDEASDFSFVVEQSIHKLNFGKHQLGVDLGAELSSPFTQNSVDDGVWNTTNILSGIPNITRETYEMFVPQMVNLDIIGGVSFKKGCYTGQEIVARMHYLGKLKQRMFQCTLTDKVGVTVQNGDKVFLKSDQGETKSAGNLVSVDKVGQSALAALRIEMVETHQTFHLENGSELKINNTQPYDLSL